MGNAHASQSASGHKSLLRLSHQTPQILERVIVPKNCALCTGEIVLENHPNDSSLLGLVLLKPTFTKSFD